MSDKYIFGYRWKNRSAVIRYVICTVLLLLLAAVLQVTLLSKFRLLGVLPDLMLCTVVCVAFFCGRYMGAITGIAGGFLIYALGSPGITLLPLVYFLCGYITGHYAKSVGEVGYLSFVGYISASAAIRVVVSGICSFLEHSDLRFFHLLLHTLLPEFLLTLILGLILYFPLRAFSFFVMQKRRR